MAEQVAQKVAEHDQQNRKPTQTELEEQELQARIAANLKPADEKPRVASVVPPAPNLPAVTAARRPSVMPDGSPIPEMNREALLERALSNLVKKLDAMAAHPQFKEVWRTAAIQQVDFSDCPIWKPERDWAKQLLDKP